MKNAVLCAAIVAASLGGVANAACPTNEVFLTVLQSHVNDVVNTNGFSFFDSGINWRTTQFEVFVPQANLKEIIKKLQAKDITLYDSGHGACAFGYGSNPNAPATNAGAIYITKQKK